MFICAYIATEQQLYNRTPLNSPGYLAALGFIFNCKVLKSVLIPLKQTDCLGFTTKDHNVMKVKFDRGDPSMSVRET